MATPYTAQAISRLIQMIPSSVLDKSKQEEFQNFLSKHQEPISKIEQIAPNLIALYGLYVATNEVFRYAAPLLPGVFFCGALIHCHETVNSLGSENPSGSAGDSSDVATQTSTSAKQSSFSLTKAISTFFPISLAPDKKITSDTAKVILIACAGFALLPRINPLLPLLALATRVTPSP